MPAILQARDLDFRYAGRPVFSGLTFSVEAGSMTALLGANGVGKTTLLNLVAGLLRPNRGSILVDDCEVHDWDRRLQSRFVALVPQHLDVPFSFRVKEIVAQGRVPYVGAFGTLSVHDWRVVEEAMRAVDVEHFGDRVYSELSGGEKQRVKIAIALAQEPELMLLDEPTQHLDIGRQIEIVSLIQRLNQRGITVVAAIHDLGMVRESFADSILLLNGSCVSGATAEIMRSDLLEEAFSAPPSALKPYCAEPDFVRQEQRDRRHKPRLRDRFRSYTKRP